MFGATNPFGLPTNQSVFGQTNSVGNNPFGSKPFGSPSPFGSQTGGSMFGGTSTGVFGVAQSASALGSTAFGNSASSGFGQKPAFGGFGSTPTQTSPFGSTPQQSQPASGSSPFGSSTAPFGTSNQPTFGATSTAFGSTNTLAFGAPSSPAFGVTATNAFGTTTSPSFGGTGGAFGGASTFGSGGALGVSSTSPFGAPSTPAYNFGSTPAMNSNPFGNGSSFAAQSSPFGTQSTTPAFSNTSFGQSRGGSRIASYTPTTDTDNGKLWSISAMPAYKEKSHEELRWEDFQLGDKGGSNTVGQGQPTNVFGIKTSTAQPNPFTSPSTLVQSSPNPFSSTMPSSPFTPSNTGASFTSTFNTSSIFATSSSMGFGTSPSLFASTPGQSSTPAFNGFNTGGTQSSPLFTSTAPSLGQTSSPSSAFGLPTSAFGQPTSAFGQPTSAFGQPTSAVGQQPSPSFGQTTSAFGQQPSPSFGQQPSPSFGQPTSGFGQQQSLSFGPQTSALGQTTSAFGQQLSPSFGPQTSKFGQNLASSQSNQFSTPSTGFPSTQFPSSNTLGFGLTTSSTPAPFQSPQPANIGQTQSGVAGGLFGTFSQSSVGQMPTSQSTLVSQPALMTNPYGVLPVMPQMSIDRVRNSPSIQYGISSMPVIEKSAPVRISSLLTSRHISQRRMRLPARNYHPKQDGQRVAFFNDDEEISSTPKADALFIPRENPRSLVIRPKEQWSSRPTAEKATLIKETVKLPVYENGEKNESLLKGCNGEYKDSNGKYKGKNKVENGIFEDPNISCVHGAHSIENGGSSSILNGKTFGEARANIDSLIPKLQRSDYYTEPRIEEIAAKERAEPGFCQHVKNFVIGRHGYGSITFLDKTNVEGLDLELLVQFNNREVIVYMDESKKPPIGEGLNKPAEVTLLNIKCVDKKSGTHYIEGPKIDKYREMLKKKVDDQGAQFVSYDPVKGEWKFRVSHF